MEIGIVFKSLLFNILNTGIPVEHPMGVKDSNDKLSIRFLKFDFIKFIEENADLRI